MKLKYIFNLGHVSIIVEIWLKLKIRVNLLPGRVEKRLKTRQMAKTCQKNDHFLCTLSESVKKIRFS
jgi:hypothetical protein